MKVLCDVSYRYADQHFDLFYNVDRPEIDDLLELIANIVRCNEGILKESPDITVELKYRNGQVEIFKFTFSVEQISRVKIRYEEKL